MTIKELLNKGAFLLKSEKIESPILKARLLLQYILQKPRQYLIIYDNQKVDEETTKKYLTEIKKIVEGVPLQHITHIQEFMRLNFYVDKDVLIPRPDTEILVEEVMNLCKNKQNVKILDMCTGSGAIAVSLAKYVKNARVTAVDISDKALRIAKKNAKQNEVENKIQFIKSNLFENLSNDKYDILVSNPPYIRTEVIKSLDREVKKEPKIALDGGIDGLDFYRKIIKEGYMHLKYGGFLCLEIGYDQKEEVIKLIEKDKKYANIYSKKDLCDNDRIVIAKLGD